jgi:cyclophilin family peptidyl-prolyl cis-trans isomerase
MGDITINFYDGTAPNTIDNFKKLAESSYYNNLTFHRVIKGFMIQSGDPKGDGTGGAAYNGGTIADEINADSLGLDKEIVGSTSAVYGQLTSDEKSKDANMTVKAYYESKGFHYIDTVMSHKIVAGSVAMANYGPDTNGSQFFIVTDSPQPHLDGQHTVFGFVSKGMDVVKKISEVPTDSSTDKPTDPVNLKSVEILDN